jgi:hypothetical protein
MMNKAIVTLLSVVIVIVFIGLALLIWTVIWNTEKPVSSLSQTLDNIDTSDIPGYPYLKIPKRYQFNHTHQFILKDKELFGRKWPAYGGDKWFKIPTSFNPVNFSADGCNLLVQDSEGTIHYRKIITENRTTKGNYEWEDKLKARGWKRSFWSLPWLIFKHGTQLRINSDIWGTSQKGLFQWWYQILSKDGRQSKKHFEWKFGDSTGISMAYFVENGKLMMADPCAGSFEVPLELANDENIVSLSCSASSIILLLEDENGVKSIKTITADYDTLGHNLIYNITRKDIQKQESWVRHEFHDKEILYPTVVQGGNGNHNVWIHVMDSVGKVWAKKIHSNEWTLFQDRLVSQSLPVE